MSLEERPFSAAEARHATLRNHSAEVLADMPHAYGTQSFILSEEEAHDIADAIHERSNRKIQSLVGGVLDAAVEDYMSTTPKECIGLWDDSMETIFGEGITLSELLSDNDGREFLNSALTGSEKTQIGLETTEYLKLLETIAIATMSEDGFTHPPEARRWRSGGSEVALYNRSVTVLDAIADTTPGVRTVREDVLNTDSNALNKYLASIVRARSAQETIASLVTLDAHDIRRQKAEITRVLSEENTEHDLDIEDLVHILNWKILTDEGVDRATQHSRIKKIIETQSQTENQRARLVQDWCPERLDFLIEIAEMAKQQGRHPSMYISNRFEEGAGVYVVVELDSPSDPAHKIAFADNPLAGNALYIVDEVRLANEGRPNEWQNVFGANRRIARERGALRKYHTKNWQAILPTVMSIGDQPEPAAADTARPSPLPVEVYRPHQDTEAVIERARMLQARIRKLAAEAAARVTG